MIMKWRKSINSSHQTFPTKVLTCLQPSEGFISKNSRDLSKMPWSVTLCQNKKTDPRNLKIYKHLSADDLTTGPGCLIALVLLLDEDAQQRIQKLFLRIFICTTFFAIVMRACKVIGSNNAFQSSFCKFSYALHSVWMQLELAKWLVA
jgi:hypothetical protein